MIISISAQAFLFFGAVAAGAALGLLYDFFRIIRKTLPHKNIAVQIEDALYILACVGLMFAFLLHQNFGEIRPFAILGAALGMVLYFCTVGKVVLPVMVTLVNWLLKIIFTAVRIIIKPVRFVLRILPIRKLRKNLRVMLKKV